MAAKNSDVDGDGIATTENMEGTAQDWVYSCGVCHVGGGQLEKDRDMNDYSASSNTGDKSVVYYSVVPGKDGFTVDPGWMSSTNKAEMDCLLCHLDAGMNQDGNGRSLYKTWGCSNTMPLGPANDKNCNGVQGETIAVGVVESNFGMMAATGEYLGVAKSYDMFNRNFALKSYRADLAASMGLGAIGQFTGSNLTGISWDGGAPPAIAASQIAGTPKSANCAPCHARNDMTVGLPGMVGMKTGFGNYFLMFAPGTMDDADTHTLNAKTWFDFGCKTGMGKRTHRIGLADPQGDNQFTNTGAGNTPANMMEMMDMMANVGANGVYSPINMAGQPAGAPIANKMPDIDVHDRAGMQCGTCHYALGTLDADTDMNLDGTLDARTFPAGTYHGLAYPAEVVGGMDHQFAQADSFPDVKSKNNLDDTVSCESCHTLQGTPEAHPRAVALGAPVPTHATLPAMHLDKIACATCHIPEVYASPGRLKYRDWTVGFFKGNFRNMLDWNFSMTEGAHAPMPVMKQWLTKYHETKIYPVLPSIMPIWIESVANNGTEKVGGVTGDGKDFNGTAYPTGTMSVPVKNRDVVQAAEAVALAHPEYDIRLNGGNAIPFFDGFVLADAWEIDTKAEIDAMLDAFQSTQANAQVIKFFHTAFDVTHGVVPKDWALGGSKRSACHSCHSSADPTNANYHPDSVGFFEGMVQPLNNAVQTLASMGLPTNLAIGQFDIVNNWFSFFANFDCTALCGAGSLTDNQLFDPMTGAPVSGTVCGAMSPMHNMVDSNGNGNPADEGADATINNCVGMMQSIADSVFGIPGFASMVGMNDGIAGLQGFLVRETVSGDLKGCDPFKGTAGKNACMSHPDGNLLYTRAEVRSHYKIDLQQSYKVDGSGNPKKRVTWPVPGAPAGYDQADYCQDQGVSTGNPFAPAVGKCAGADGIGGNADDLVGMDGKLHIATGIQQNLLLGYNTTSLAMLMKDQMSTSSYFGSLKSRFSATQDTTVSRKVNFSSTYSECPTGATCTKSWNFGDGQTGTGNSPSHTYVNASGVCVGDASPNNGIATGTCSNNGSACDTNNDCFYQVTMTITDDLGYSDASSMPVATTEVAPVPAGEPTASVVVNTTTNAVVLTVTAGAETVDSVYIDWVDGTSNNNGTDILPGANRGYNHTYSTAPRAEKLYKIRVKVRTKSATGVYTYHYLTVNADVR